MAVHVLLWGNKTGRRLHPPATEGAGIEPAHTPAAKRMDAGECLPLRPCRCYTQVCGAAGYLPLGLMLLLAAATAAAAVAGKVLAERLATTSKRVSQSLTIMPRTQVPRIRRPWWYFRRPRFGPGCQVH